VELEVLLRLDPRGEARRRGTVVHAWCEAVEWMDEGLPDDSALEALARLHAPGIAPDRLEAWRADFRRWMEAPAIRSALSRGAYPSGAGLRVERELPFLHRTPDGILQGFIDRLVVVEERGIGERGGGVIGAEVLDFKTDVLDPADAGAVEEKVAYYRPQIEAYRQAVEKRHGLDPSTIRGRLLFLSAGLVRDA
jgi:ATP-dependent exoDNAse (exonuclease V) beta subunit